MGISWEPAVNSTSDKHIVKLLLTSAGIKNKSIETALIELLGKPIAESRALFIPTGMYLFPRHASSAWQVFCGRAKPVSANSVGRPWAC